MNSVIIFFILRLLTCRLAVFRQEGGLVNDQEQGLLIKIYYSVK